jgi:LysM domain
MGRSGQIRLRLLAPLSLAVFSLFLLWVVFSSVGGSSSKHPGGPSAGGARSASGPHGVRRGRRFYVVKAGDTLARIAARTGVPLPRLQALNPSVDPQTLVTGQRIRLRQ